MNAIVSGESEVGVSGYVEGQSSSVSVLARKLLPILARRKATQKYYSQASASYFYELGSGWETKILEQDNEILKVYTSREMEQAFQDPKTKTILIPKDAAITKTVALRICSRNGLSKTIFYEAADE